MNLFWQCYSIDEDDVDTDEDVYEEGDEVLLPMFFTWAFFII